MFLHSPAAPGSSAGLQLAWPAPPWLLWPPSSQSPAGPPPALPSSSPPPVSWPVPAAPAALQDKVTYKSVMDLSVTVLCVFWPMCEPSRWEMTDCLHLQNICGASQQNFYIKSKQNKQTSKWINKTAPYRSSRILNDLKRALLLLLLSSLLWGISMILKETGEGSKAMLHISESNPHSLKPADSFQFSGNNPDFFHYWSCSEWCWISCLSILLFFLKTQGLI